MELSRRKFIGTTIAAGTTAAVFALTGCGTSQSEKKTTEESFDLNKTYLPIGSVVRITWYGDVDISIMIVSRKPFISSPPEGYESTVFDYAGVLYPFGIQSDLSKHEYQGELTAFMSTDITEILHIGYQDEHEQQAVDVLQANRDSKDFGVTLLSEQYQDTCSKIKDYLSSENDNK